METKIIKTLPVVNAVWTGQNIYHLMHEREISVKDVQEACGFSTPQAVYKWFNGQSIPSVDNLVILAHLLGATIDDIIITERK